MFLAYSAVSEHYDRRFSQYLAGGRQDMDMAEKAGLVVASLKELLGPEPGPGIEALPGGPSCAALICVAKIKRDRSLLIFLGRKKCPGRIKASQWP